MELHRPNGVLFDRDGTLIEDVPYNGDAELVRALPGVVDALARLRSAGIRTGVVTNQSGVARGIIDPRGVDAVNHRVETLLGPFDVWAVCPHDDGAGCSCRKPRPGLVLQACSVMGLAPRRVVVVGDIGSDVAAAHAAGARGVLVPNEMTRRAEVAAATDVFDTLGDAVDAILGWPA